MSEYEEGYYDNQHRFGGNSNRSFQNGQAVGSLVGAILGGLVRLVPVLLPLLGKLLLFAPFLVVGLAAGAWLPAPGQNGHLAVGVGLAYGYGLVLYFLKGLGVALRLRNKRRGQLVLGLFVVGACVVPALVLHQVLVSVPAGPDASLSWALAGVLAVFAFFTTRPLRDYAPSLGLWAYHRGYLVAGR